MAEPRQGQPGKSKAPVPGGYLEDPCFDAQQVSDKAIKALLIAVASTFRTRMICPTC